MVERKKLVFRLIALILALVLVTGWIPTVEVSATAQGLTLDELMEKFPDGKYWNGGNADSWTEKPCTHHGSCSYNGTCGCNSFLGYSIQCMGFAEKLGYDATGYNPRLNENGWYTYKSTSALNNLKPGDIVRRNGHSMYVIGVDGDTVTIADCNSSNRSCNIRWGATVTISNLKNNFEHVRSAPVQLVTGYLGKCQEYPSCGTVSLRTDSVLMTYPCTQQVYDGALEVAAVTAGTVLNVTGLYQNTLGEYWYEAGYEEETVYFPALDGEEIALDWGNVTAENVTAPIHIRQGRGFALYGNIRSDILPLTRVGAYAFTGTALTEAPYMTSEDTAVKGNTYLVRGSTVDNNLTFGSLPAGDYTYLLAAEVTNYYIADGSLTHQERMIRLHQNTFTVSSRSISCSHSYAAEEAAQTTCGDDGLTVYTCTKCGFSYTQTGFATGNHSLGQWVTVQEPTCTEAGYQSRSCQGCTLAYTAQLPATGHSAVTDPAVAATCTRDGLTEGSHCEVCGTVLTAQEVIRSSGHNEQTVEVPPTCTEQGYTEITCTLCGESFREDYEDALGHSYESVVTPEQTVYTCTVCGHSYAEENKVPAAPAVRLRFMNASLVLEADLTLNFYVRAAVLAEYDDVWVSYTMNGETVEVREGIPAGDDRYYPFEGIAPRMMNDTISATLHGTFDGVAYEYTMQYSASDYCYNVLNTASDEKLNTLLVDLLNYGTAHQRYTDYRTEYPVNGNLTQTQAALGTAGDPALESILTGKYIVHDSPTVMFKAPALKLTNAVEMAFTLNCAALENMDGVTLSVQVDDARTGLSAYTVDASQFRYDGETDTYKVYFKDLMARQLRTPVYVTVLQNGEAVSHTVRYSVESYAFSMHENTGYSGLADLVKAMMRYGDAAYSYIYG